MQAARRGRSFAVESKYSGWAPRPRLGLSSNVKRIRTPRISGRRRLILNESKIRAHNQNRREQHTVQPQAVNLAYAEPCPDERSRHGFFLFAGRVRSECATLAGKSRLSADFADDTDFRSSNRRNLRISLARCASQEMEKGVCLMRFDSTQHKAIEAEASGSTTLRENGTAPASGYPSANALLRRCARGSKVGTVFEMCASWKSPKISSKMRTFFQGAHENCASSRRSRQRSHARERWWPGYRFDRTVPGRYVGVLSNLFLANL
jgi:hypothetical protein